MDAEGKVSWEKKLTTELASPPVVSHGLVIARTMDTRVSAFEASSGELQWTYQRSQPALTVRLPTRMLAHDNFLLVGQPNGHIVILDIASGKPMFEFQVAQAKGVTEVERLVDVVGAPAFSDNLVCAAAFQGAVTCVDSTNGQTRWTQRLMPSQVLPLTKTTFMPSASTEKSRPSTAKAENSAGPIRPCSTADFPRRSYSGAVAVGDEDGYVHFLSPRTGEEMARVRLSGPIVTQAQPFSAGAIFQTSKGDVAYLSNR